MTPVTEVTARGSAVHATIEFIRATYGAKKLDQILGQLARGDRALLRDAGLQDHVPYEKVRLFWDAADKALGPIDADWMETAGAFSIGSLGRKLYGGLLRKASPGEFVTQSVSLFKLFYSHGSVMPVEVGAGRAVLRLVGFEEHGVLFCRRQTGGLRSAAEIAGGLEVTVKHVRCTDEGDAYCEWEMTWR